MRPSITAPSSLQILSDGWNQLANELTQRYGVVRGTRKFLAQLLRDQWFQNEIALVSSFGGEASVPLLLVSALNRNLRVIFLETGYSFAETLAYRDVLTNRLQLSNVKTYEPTLAQSKRIDPYGMPPICCDEVKVDMLSEALRDYSIWISGRKRYQGEKRIDIPMVEIDGDKIKINPLALWSEAQVKSFMRRHHLPRHELSNKGYGSIGCASCTVPGKGRSGRWPGINKSECGIHGLEFDGSGI